jgi:AraC-like DNA-binding protein
MVREFPRVPAVALLTEVVPATPQAVLSLGRSGVRTLVDVRQPAGWRELRQLLMDDRAAELERSALALLTADLAGAPEGCRRFFDALFTAPPSVATVRRLTDVLEVVPSTLMSRFLRAGLPSPKRYLATARLARAARLFENAGLSVANVAAHLDYSSPQSFGRHVRTLLGLTAGAFRQRYDGDGMVERFRAELVRPHAAALRAFDPLRVTWHRAAARNAARTRTSRTARTPRHHSRGRTREEFSLDRGAGRARWQRNEHGLTVAHAQAGEYANPHSPRSTSPYRNRAPMIISTTTRRIAAVSTTVAAAALAACGTVDAPTAVTSQPDATAANHNTSYVSSITTSSGSGSGSSGSSSVVTSTNSSGSGSGTSTVTVTVYPSTSVTMTIGNHRLRLPAGTICDPARSGYGPSVWDAPCAPSSGPVTITARSSTNGGGHPRVDFSPALRFTPNANGEVVTLKLLDREAAASGGFTVLYCRDGAECIDESLTDASLATRTDPISGYLFRQLKHFSGYSVAVGRRDDGM